MKFCLLLPICPQNMVTVSTHTHTRLFLWIVGTFHRLLLYLYWPNNIFYPLTLNLHLTENLFALLHFQINIIYHFLYFFPLVGTAGRSPQCQKCQVFLSLWGYSIGVMGFILSPPTLTLLLNLPLRNFFFLSLDPKKDNDFRYCHLCGDILSP